MLKNRTLIHFYVIFCKSHKKPSKSRMRLRSRRLQIPHLGDGNITSIHKVGFRLRFNIKLKVTSGAHVPVKYRQILLAKLWKYSVQLRVARKLVIKILLFLCILTWKSLITFKDINTCEHSTMKVVCSLATRLQKHSLVLRWTLVVKITVVYHTSYWCRILLRLLFAVHSGLAVAVTSHALIGSCSLTSTWQEGRESVYATHTASD